MRFKTDSKDGLSADEATRRLDDYGPNELQTQVELPWYRVVARQFRDVLIFILIAAGAISLVLGETGDALAILSITTEPILDRAGILTVAAIGTYMGLATLWLFHQGALVRLGADHGRCSTRLPRRRGVQMGALRSSRRCPRGRMSAE